MDFMFIKLVLLLILFAVPIYILYYFGVRIAMKSLVAVLKMLAVMLLFYVVLRYVFLRDSVLLNLLCVALLVLWTFFSTLKSCRSHGKKFILPLCTGLFSAAVLIGIMAFFILNTGESMKSSHFVIPLFALLTGNLGRALGKALSDYYMGLKHRGQLYYNLLGNGATHREAANYFIRRALESASVSYVADMSRLVLGAAPAVMWAVMLAGGSVGYAILAQIVVFAASFCIAVVALVITLSMARRTLFDDYSRLVEER